MVVASGLQLTVYLGKDVVRQIPLDAPVVTAGRSEENDIVLADPKISRHHLRFVRQPDGTYTAEDGGSVNGTWLGEQRIQRARLVDGLILRAGPFTLITRGSVP